MKKKNSVKSLFKNLNAKCLWYQICPDLDPPNDHKSKVFFPKVNAVYTKFQHSYSVLTCNDIPMTLRKHIGILFGLKNAIHVAVTSTLV
jgi:hypothetical protein